MPRTLFTGIATLALAMTGCFIVFASGAKQSPGRVNYLALLSPIVGVADTSPAGGSKKYVILSASEISHHQSDKVYATALLRKRAVFNKVLNLSHKKAAFYLQNRAFLCYHYNI